MEEKHTDATAHRPRGERAIDASLVSIDLPLFMKQVKAEPAFESGHRNAITVFKSNGLRIVLIALHEGASIAKHSTEGIISVQVLEGDIEFSTEEQCVRLAQGQMITLHERIPHSVIANSEAIFLLTIASSTNEK
jgi:quercetin dioxygenase-like cupin family protein